MARLSQSRFHSLSSAVLIARLYDLTGQNQSGSRITIFVASRHTPNLVDKGLFVQRQSPAYARLKDLVVQLPDHAELPSFMQDFERMSLATGRPSTETTLVQPIEHATHHFLDGSTAIASQERKCADLIQTDHDASAVKTRFICT